jgi:archaellum component FlaC
MRWQHLGVAALAVLLLAGLNRLTAADQPSAKAHAKGHHSLDTLAAKLGLNDQQKEQIEKLHADYRHREGKLEAQLHHLHHEEWQAASKVLTDDQRTKAHELFRAAMQKELDKMENQLGLSSDQKEKIQKIRADYHQRIEKLAGQTGDKTHAQIRELRHKEFTAMHDVLSKSQQAQLPRLMREERHAWRNPADLHARMKSFEDKLGLKQDQRDQLEKIHSEYDQKIQSLEAKLKDLHHQQHEAFMNVLTADQRTKLHELHEAHHKAGQQSNK